MGMSQPAHPRHTLQDWESWEGRWELIDGIAFDMAAAPNTSHQRISGNLYFAIRTGLKSAGDKFKKNSCEIFAAPIDVFFQDFAVVQPDLVVVCDPAKISERGIEGAPDLVVEILSPATAKKDLLRKRWLYEASKVPEYLIVDPEDHCGLLLRLDENGHYIEAARVEWEGLIPLLNGRVQINLC